MIRQFFKDSLIYGVTSIFTRGLAFFLVPLYTRVLSPTDYGAMDLLAALGSLANLTVALEVSQGVARYYGEAPTSTEKVAYASTAWWFTVSTYTLFAVLGLLFSSPLTRLILGDNQFEQAFRLAIAVIWFNGLFYLLQNQLRWELRSREYAGISLTYSLTTMGAATALTYGLKYGLVGVLAGQVMGGAVACGIGWWRLRRSFAFCFRVDKLKEMLMFSAPMVPAGVAVFVSLYIDRLTLNYLTTLHEVGIFGIGYRLASVSTLAIAGFQSALMPLVYANYRDPQTPTNLARIFRWFCAFALTVSLFIGIFAREVLYVITTPEYYGAARVVILLAPALLLSNMYIFAPGISISKKNYYKIWISVSVAALNTILNFIMIPIFGITGAALATLISAFALFLAYMSLGQKFYFIPHNWRRLVWASLIACVLGTLGTFVSISPEADVAIKSLILLCSILAFIRIKVIEFIEIRQAAALLYNRLFLKRSEM